MFKIQFLLLRKWMFYLKRDLWKIACTWDHMIRTQAAAQMRNLIHSPSFKYYLDRVITVSRLDFLSKFYFHVFHIVNYLLDIFHLTSSGWPKWSTIFPQQCWSCFCISYLCMVIAVSHLPKLEKSKLS